MEKKFKPDSKLSSASEYALIFGAGASAAMSLAAQQVAAASLPVTALVAIGLVNRHRLDQRIQASKSPGPTSEAHTARNHETSRPEVTAQPMPTVVSAKPAAGGSFAPSPTVHFSDRQQRILAAKHALKTSQVESLRHIGAHLRQVRAQQDLSIQDIHSKTFIQRYALKAIEDGDVDALPEAFYVRAFIQKYAIALGLPGTELAAQFPIS